MYEQPYVASGQYAAPQAVPEPAPTQQYAPVEPGMYSDMYLGPGAATDPPPSGGGYSGAESGAIEPGMYDPPYHGPGQYAPQYDPLEPGIYEERYRQPGQYAPQSASTYYGGSVWPPYNTGAAQPGASGRPLSGVFTSHPSTGAPPERRFIPSGGTVIQPGASVYPVTPPMPGATSRGDVYGAMSGRAGSAPPHPAITLGPTPPELYYRMLQHDPGVVATSRGKLIERRDLAAPVADDLKGLFGGGEQRSSQPMPLPPGTTTPRKLRNERRRF